jgi:hypothetical protein
MLQPLAAKDKYLDKLVEGALKVWLKKSELGTGVKVNRCYEKLIQILICL